MSRFSSTWSFYQDEKAKNLLEDIWKRRLEAAREQREAEEERRRAVDRAVASLMEQGQSWALSPFF